jgi:hypothetical protein
MVKLLATDLTPQSQAVVSFQKHLASSQTQKTFNSFSNRTMSYRLVGRFEYRYRSWAPTRHLT